MKKKALVYIFIFAAGALTLNYINVVIEKSKLKNLTYQKGVIYNFQLVSKNSGKIVIKGSKIVDKGKFLYGFNINSVIEKENNLIKIKAREGIYDKKDKVRLKDDVAINFNKKIDLYTDTITIDLQNSVAYNHSKNIITAKNMKTVGSNIYLDFKNEKIKLRKVKTIISEE